MRGPGWSGVILVSLATSCVVSLIVYLATERGVVPAPGLRAFGDRVPRPTTMASVPALEGMALSAATELLQARGLTVLVRDKREHATLPPESVVAQDPLPGSMLAPQAPVALTLSSGKPAETRVPELVGRSLDEAVRALQSAGLEAGALSGPASGARNVARSDPEAGAALPPGASVALTLVAADLEVPKLVGLPWARAKTTIEESGFKVGAVRERYDEYRDPWVVLKQTPEAGTRVAPGASIDVVRVEGD